MAYGNKHTLAETLSAQKLPVTPKRNQKQQSARRKMAQRLRRTA